MVIAASTSLVTSVVGCTGQLPNSFRLKQAEESFGTTQDVNTKIDMLWVIDNSSSMDVSQARLRDGFRTFAQKYMKPNWDIRVGVITTDAFLAHSNYANWLNSQYEATGYKSNYLAQTTANGIPGRATPFVNPAWAPSLVNTTVGTNYGKFTNGSKVKDNWPKYGPNWAKLLAGNHDGPMTTLCYEDNPYFFYGVAPCRVRDDERGNRGVANCVSPGVGESSTTQCINTSMNDTVHSGKAYISTMPPEGVAADQTWTNQLISDFLVNLSPGASGNGSERGLQSVLQMLKDNESSKQTAFFRPGSLRVITFVSDEEDQSIVEPATAPAGYGPFTYYSSSNCQPKTVDGYTYTLSTCVNASKLMPVSTIKSQFDQFFQNLDKSADNATPDPNYFVITITPLTGQSLQSLHQERCAEEQAIFGSCSTACDRADRYIGLGNLVGNGSLAMDITSSDYTPMLDRLGQIIVSKKSVFVLNRAPTGEEDMMVAVKHADGTVTAMRPDQYVVDDKTLTVTDYNFLLTLSSTDQISISYQPKTVF